MHHAHHHDSTDNDYGSADNHSHNDYGSTDNHDGSTDNHDNHSHNDDGCAVNDINNGAADYDAYPGGLPKRLLPTRRSVADGLDRSV